MYRTMTHLPTRPGYSQIHVLFTNAGFYIHSETLEFVALLGGNATIILCCSWGGYLIGNPPAYLQSAESNIKENAF